MSNVRVHPEGILCQTDEKGPPALCVWTVQAPVILHCEFSWHDFVGARGSVSEGVVIQILGVFVVRILFFKCHRCLSEFFLTFRNHKQEYRPLNLKWTKEGHPPPQPQLGWGTALSDGRGNAMFKMCQSNIKGRSFPPCDTYDNLSYYHR